MTVKKTLFLLLIFFTYLSGFAQKKVMIMEIKAGIDPVMNRYVNLALDHAEESKMDMVIIDMDTYGGAVLDADEIRMRILNYKKPIHVFINKNAGSAGSLISIACDSIYMAPGSSFGASTVVNQEGEVVPEKYQSFMRSKMRATAEAQGRTPEIAEGMVGLYLSTDSAKVIAYTPSEAMENDYCEAELTSIEAILERNNIIDYKLETYEVSRSEKIIAWFLNPVLKSLLILVILGGLYFELQTPGVGFPLAAAGAALIMYFVPDYLHGLLDNWEFVVFLLGMGLIVLEVFVIPGFGVAGISGIVLVVLSLGLSMLNNQNLDFTFVGSRELLSAFGIIMISLFGSAMMIVFGAPLLARSASFQKNVALSSSITEKANEPNKKGLIGKEGITYTVLRPSGKIDIDGNIYDANTNGSFIDQGIAIVVLNDDGRSLKVKKKG